MMNELLKKRIPLLVLAGVLVLAVGFGSGLLGRSVHERRLQEEEEEAAAGSAVLWEPTLPTPAPTVPAEPSSVTLVHCGDLLCEYPLLDACYDRERESFDFSPCFTYIRDILTAGDLTAANLECVLNGITAPVNEFNEHGYARLLAPDAFLADCLDAGFNVLTTANNHANDGGMAGMRRTLDKLDEAGVLHTGTRGDEADKPYLVTRVNDIGIGIVAYTYESERDDGTKALNGNTVERGREGLFDSFNEAAPGSGFYREIEARIRGARADGADLVVVYVHWGMEFTNSSTVRQETIAQRLCEMGVDLIVGCHPHVVQNFALLTDERTGKKVPCAYSLGSVVTQIRTEDISAHCEDGVVLTTTFTKAADGTVSLTAFETQPVWVNRYRADGQTFYQTIPVGADTDYTAFPGTDAAQAEASYKRTMRIIADGVEQILAGIG